MSASGVTKVAGVEGRLRSLTALIQHLQIFTVIEIFIPETLKSESFLLIQKENFLVNAQNAKNLDQLKRFP
jgi:hypothetical protein